MLPHSRAFFRPCQSLPDLQSLPFILPFELYFPLHQLGAKWVHLLTLTFCALDPRALTSSPIQPKYVQKPRRASLKPPRAKPFNDSPR
ncbi:hypothetical protein B7R76_04050 [Mageeibacillus indolicus]|uniref:Uncharacterized protein n=1 Tax=Mageeibacillus indolicus TaxID=884684 RepID=A0A2J8B1T4_9FIRM|nr:hypothetical protein B7R76_04050 [Mageeibacillus indolicus]